MLSCDINIIKDDLSRTNKAIVALGCSFVQGSELSDIEEQKNKLSFVNVLCEEFLQGTYTPINFGQEAAGNYAAISRLFLYDIPWSKLDDLIVLFMPTGMQRFDIIKDELSFGVGTEFKTLWPAIATSRIKGDEYWRDTNFGYGMTCHSDRFEVLNTILNFQILNTWANLYRAKLYIYPAFNNEYNKYYFDKKLSETIYREHKTHLIVDNGMNIGYHYDNDFLINSVPWDRFLTLENSQTFFDLCYKRDPCYKLHYSMQEVVDNKLYHNNDWIMPRGHPSANGHKLLAQRLFEKLF